MALRGRAIIAASAFAAVAGFDAEARRDSTVPNYGVVSVLESTGYRIDPSVVRFGVGGDVESFAVGTAAVAADASTRIRHMDSDADFAMLAAPPERAGLQAISAPDFDSPARTRAHARLGFFDALALERARGGRDEAGSMEQTVRDAALLPGRAENRMRRPDAQEELRCLTEAVYYEARGESIDGQIAVAEVIMNRVESKLFPDTVCEVISQGASRLNACQFSYKCDGVPERMSNRAARRRAADVAILLMKGERRLLTDKATHYHANYVSPRWSKKMKQTAVYGDHIFYRRKPRS